MNKLEKYLEKTNETPTAFARRSGVPQPTIWRALNSKRPVSPENALKIEQATDGEIKRYELLYPDRPDLWETAA
jgi:DNA-binding transcriptional regulator YdaS (Cro superfamily)